MNVKYFDKRGQVWISFNDAEGKRHRCPTGCTTQAAAEAAAPAIILKKLTNHPTTSKVAQPQLSTGGMTFRQAFEKGLRERENWIDSKDKKSIHMLFEKVAEYWGEDSPVTKANRQTVMEWRSAMLKEKGKRLGTTLSNSTINHRLSMLTTLLELADAHPHTVKHLSTKNNRRKRRTRDEELQGVVTWLLANHKRKNATTMADLVQVGLETTARIGELLDLLWSDVYLDRGTCVFRDPKNSEAREVVLTDIAMRVLERRRAYGGDGPFKGLNKWQASALWRDARTALGLGDDVEFVFHVATRHEGLSRLGEMGASAFQIKAAGGHKTIAAADRYVKPEAESLRDLMNGISSRSLFVNAPTSGTDELPQ